MKQAIAGLSLSSQHEATALVVWPSVSATSIGKSLGRLYQRQEGWGLLRLGHLFALASIPIAIPLYLANVLPVIGTRYRITNRRVLVERGVAAVVEREIGLDQFDRIEIEQQPGQAWFRSADLVFWADGAGEGEAAEVFRLAGVAYPESFRAACRKGAMTYRGFQEVRQRQTLDS